MKNTAKTYPPDDTAIFQLGLLNIAVAIQLSLPSGARASARTDSSHSLRGLPTRLTYMSVAGCHVPGTKDTMCIELSTSTVQMLPKRTSCRSNSAADVDETPGRRLTSTFEIRD